VKQATLRKLIAVAMLVVLAVFFSIQSPYFLTAANLSAILRDASVAGIVGVGITYVILTAGIDLSTGSVMALVGMTMANIYTFTLWPIWLMILIGLLVGAVCGLVNGLIVTKLHLPEFIATLATMGIYRSLVYVIAIRDGSGSIQSVQMKAVSFTFLGGKAGAVYYVVIAFAAIILLGQFILKKTRFGTDLYAVGSNYKAAQLSGIPTDRIRIGAFVLTGVLAAVGGIFTIARLQSTTVLLGDGFNFDPIAAAVIGGCALDGGDGDILGTFLGALFMAALDNGILKLQLNTAYQYVIKGVIIILVVIFDAWYRRMMQKRALARETAKEAAV
jgi:ribose transport system permease protein